MNREISKQVLEGIVAGACKHLGLDTKQQQKLKILAGGRMFGNDAQDEWYVPLQNVEGTVNTKKAYEAGLVRRCFGIYKKNAENKSVLFIDEWSAKVDTSGVYRRIWREEDDMSKRKDMMDKFIGSYRELVEHSQEPVGEKPA